MRQLNFNPDVVDVMARPIVTFIHGRQIRHYVADLLVELKQPDYAKAQLFLVVVVAKMRLAVAKRRNGEKFEAAKQWCRRHDASFVILTEAEIRTPYAANATRFYRARISTNLDRGAFAILKRAVANKPRSSRALLSHLIQKGFEGGFAKAMLLDAIAKRIVHFDFMTAYDEDAPISATPPGQTPDPLTIIFRTTASAFQPVRS